MTQQAKHTPGPWRTRDEGAPNYDVMGPDGRLLATAYPKNAAGGIGWLEHSIPESEANAKLIAAAPALDIITKLCRHRLARFEGFEFCFNGLRYSHDEDWAGLVDVIGWDTARAAISKAEGTPT